MPPTRSSPPPPTIPFPYSSLTSDPDKLPTPTQKALLTTLTALPSTTSPSPDQTALHDLSALLSDSLARTGWTDRVRALALELLRNGSCTTFPELLQEVSRRAKTPRSQSQSQHTESNGVLTVNGTSAPRTSTPTSSSQQQTKDAQTNGTSSQQSITVREGWFGPDGLPDVRIPKATVEAGVGYLRERIKECVEVVPDEDARLDSDED